MNGQNAKTWLSLFGDQEDHEHKTCKRGHAKCSITEGGECLDDVITAAINPPEPYVNGT